MSLLFLASHCAENCLQTKAKPTRVILVVPLISGTIARFQS